MNRLKQFLNKLTLNNIDILYRENKDILDLRKKKFLLIGSNLKENPKKIKIMISDYSSTTEKAIQKCHPLALTVAVNQLSRSFFMKKSRTLTDLITKGGARILQDLNSANSNIDEIYQYLGKESYILEELIAIQFYQFDQVKPENPKLEPIEIDAFENPLSA